MTDSVVYATSSVRWAIWYAEQKARQERQLSIDEPILLVKVPRINWLNEEQSAAKIPVHFKIRDDVVIYHISVKKVQGSKDQWKETIENLPQRGEIPKMEPKQVATQLVELTNSIFAAYQKSDLRLEKPNFSDFQSILDLISRRIFILPEPLAATLAEDDDLASIMKHFSDALADPSEMNAHWLVMLERLITQVYSKSTTEVQHEVEICAAEISYTGNPSYNLGKVTTPTLVLHGEISNISRNIRDGITVKLETDAGEFHISGRCLFTNVRIHPEEILRENSRSIIWTEDLKTEGCLPIGTKVLIRLYKNEKALHGYTPCMMVKAENHLKAEEIVGTLRVALRTPTNRPYGAVRIPHVETDNKTVTLVALNTPTYFSFIEEFPPSTLETFGLQVASFHNIPLYKEGTTITLARSTVYRTLSWGLPLSHYAPHFGRERIVNVGITLPDGFFAIDTNNHVAYPLRLIIMDYGSQPFISFQRIHDGQLFRHLMIGDNIKIHPWTPKTSSTLDFMGLSLPLELESLIQSRERILAEVQKLLGFPLIDPNVFKD